MTGSKRQVLCSDIPFCIRIGVTGHGALPDREKLSQRVREVLETKVLSLFDEKSKRLISSSPHTPVTLSVVTPLAEGADCLVAQEVLKLPNSKIEVVIPLAKEDYLRDFKSEESRCEFEELLTKARRPISLRRRRLEDEFADRDLAEARRQAYEDVGHYIANHCDVLIALWNGKKSRGKGGTGEVVEYAKARKRPVIVVSTVAPYNITIELGHGLNASPIIGIEMFNSFPVLEEEQQAQSKNVYGGIFETGEGRKLPEEARQNVRERLLPFYVRASKIAMRNQRIYHHAGFSVYVLAATAVVAVAMGTLFFGRPRVVFVAELVLLLAILLIVFFSRRERTHEKWIESRFLAERIRSAMFLAACGVEASPIRIPPYMGMSNQSGDWALMTFNEIWDRLAVMKGCQGQSCRALADFVRKFWIRDQIEHHEHKLKKAGKIGRYLEIGGMIIFAIALSAPLFHLNLFHLLDLLRVLLGRIREDEWLENVLIFVALALPAVGAAVEGVRSHREYSRLARRSENMRSGLVELEERFQRVTNPEALESLLREAEELMVLETRDWLMLMRFCELEPVV